MRSPRYSLVSIVALAVSVATSFGAVAQFNARDLPRLQQDWARYAREAAPGKRLALSPQPLDCIGGVLVSSADHDIRIDNTFEGRMERLGEALQGAVAERLMPQEVAHG